MLPCLHSLANCASISAALWFAFTAAHSPLSARASTCTPVAGGSGSIDDVPAIHQAFKDCSSGTIIIPIGTTYYINSAVTFAGCAGCTLQVDGILKVSNNLEYWHNQKAVFWMDGINGATVLSTTGKGLFDGNGQNAYDEFATNKTLKRASLFYVNNSHNVALKNLQFQNAPSVFHDVKGGSSNINYDKITLRAASKSSNPPKNTDGWAVGSSSFVTITNSDVTNTDDCVGFKPGCNVSQFLLLQPLVEPV
jgi:galacturan 1,4-alpha-galacturonidase